MMKNAKAGFTLAEVLTTLMVIGVVAAMTIPSLMNNAGESQNRAAAKKAMSVLSQAAQLIDARDDVACNFTANSQDDNSNELAQCFAQVMNGTLNGDTITTNDGMQYRFIGPNDGSAVATTSLATVCTAAAPNPLGIRTCGVIVDTNGSRGNTLDSRNAVSLGANGWNGNPENGGDVIAFSLTSTGATCSVNANSENKCWQYVNNATDVAARNAQDGAMCCNNDADGNPPARCADDAERYNCTPVFNVNGCGDTQTDVGANFGCTE